MHSPASMHLEIICPIYVVSAVMSKQRAAMLLRDSATMCRRPPAATAGGRGGLSVHHTLLPHSYVAACWPVRTVCVAAGALDIAVAGSRGFVLHDRRSGRWRMFGDVRQERQFVALRLAWLSSAVVACQQAAPAEGRPASDGGRRQQPAQDGCKVVVYSRFFLDASTVLAEMPLLQACPLLLPLLPGTA